MLREQQVKYTSFQCPAHITENGITASFEYKADDNRMRMTVKNGDATLLTRYYIGDCYEQDVETGVERLYLGGDAYSAPAVYVKERGSWKIYYICRDHLGSITHVVNEDGTVKQELSYDAWGRLRNPETQEAYAPGSEPILFLGRGYTGHEYLPWFGLVNMNARLYDPVLGRFLSPDPYVQMPDDTQSYNRYSYCMNNPLKYVDKDGKFWWLIPVACAPLFATGNTISHAIRGDIKNFWTGFKYFSQGAVTGFAIGSIWQFAPMLKWKNIGKAIQKTMTWYAYGRQIGLGGIGALTGVFNDGWKGLGNAAKSFLGNFYLDENNWLGGIFQGISRHTWEIPQSFIGHLYTQWRNTMGNVSRVDYFGGATFATLENAENARGVSLGNYVNINIINKITGDFDKWVLSNPMFMHEYGHTIDSRLFGFSYLLAIGIPSIISAGRNKNHLGYWTEIRANKRAKRYFSRYYNIDWSIYEKLYPTY